MTSDEFRRIARSFPGTEEQSHMGHPDFVWRSKIFATLGHPDGGRGMVKLTVEQQHAFAQTYPAAFAPAQGAWGLLGSTLVRLKQANAAPVEEALHSVGQYRAPQRKGKPRERRAGNTRGHGSWGAALLSIRKKPCLGISYGTSHCVVTHGGPFVLPH